MPQREPLFRLIDLIGRERLVGLSLLHQKPDELKQAIYSELKLLRLNKLRSAHPDLAKSEEKTRKHKEFIHWSNEYDSLLTIVDSILNSYHFQHLFESIADIKQMKDWVEIWKLDVDILEQKLKMKEDEIRHLKEQIEIRQQKSIETQNIVPLLLTPEAHLQILQSMRRRAGRLSEQGHFVLLFSSGYSIVEIASYFRTTPERVITWIEIYRRQGMTGLFVEA